MHYNKPLSYVFLMVVIIWSSDAHAKSSEPRPGTHDDPLIDIMLGLKDMSVYYKTNHRYCHMSHSTRIFMLDSIFWQSMNVDYEAVHVIDTKEITNTTLELVEQLIENS